MNNSIYQSFLYPQKVYRDITPASLYTNLVNICNLEISSNNTSISQVSSLSLKRRNILVMLLLCGYISQEEISLYFSSPYGTLSSLKGVLRELEKDKYIKTTPLKSKDSSTKTLYYLTKEGFDLTLSFFEGYQHFAEYKRLARSGVTIMHDYCVGMNAFHFILSGQPFIFKREFMEHTSLKTGRKTSKTLAMDAIVLYTDKTPEHNILPDRVYVEEDLGNEPTITLINKLDLYEAYGDMDRPFTESIVFSFRKPYIFLESDIYSIKTITTLIDELKSKGYSSLFDYFMKESGSTDTITLSKVSNPAAVPLALRVGLVDKNKKIFNQKDMSVSDIEEYCNLLTEFRNPYKVCDINLEQDNFSKGKFRSMASIMVDGYKTEFHPSPYISSMMSGFMVWAVPTNLLSNYLDYISPTISAVWKKLETTLKANYPIIRFENLLNKDYESRVQNLILRNKFTLNGRKFFFEFVSRDLGGLLRAIRFRSEHIEDKRSSTLVGIVESLGDAVFLSGNGFIDYRIDNVNGLYQNSVNNIVWLLKKDLERGELSFFEISNQGQRINAPFN